MLRTKIIVLAIVIGAVSLHAIPEKIDHAQLLQTLQPVIASITMQTSPTEKSYTAQVSSREHFVARCVLNKATQDRYYCTWYLRKNETRQALDFTDDKSRAYFSVLQELYNTSEHKKVLTDNTIN